MSNFKLIKTAAALALGASVVTSAVVPTDASAASKYKIKNGKLVIAKTGKVAKGYVTYKSTVYKNGKKLTGLKGKTYYKAGKKATGTYKGAYYYKGAKKVTTGTYKGAYYVKGVKKVTTGLYNGRYYKSGAKATGTYKGAYYVKGTKKVTTGTYNGAYYVKGYKKVTTGLYKEEFYQDGKLSKGYAVYNSILYKDAVHNVGLTVFEGKLYDGVSVNKGTEVFEGKLYKGAVLATGLVEHAGLFYNEGALANGVVDGVEYKDGEVVKYVVSSVKAINAEEVTVKFAQPVVNAYDSKFYEVTINGKSVQLDNSNSNIQISEDGTLATIRLVGTKFKAGDKLSVQVADGVKTAKGKKIERFASEIFAFEAVAPKLVSANLDKGKTKLVVTFDQPVKAANVNSLVKIDGYTITKGDNIFTPTTTAGNYTYVIQLPTAGSTITEAQLKEIVKAGQHNVVLFDVANTTPSESNPAVSSSLVGTYNVSEVETAPVVSSVTALNANKFFVVFDQDIKDNKFEIEVNKGVYTFGNETDNNKIGVAATKVFTSANTGYEKINGKIEKGYYVVVNEDKTDEANPLYKATEKSVNLSLKITNFKSTGTGLLGTGFNGNVTLSKDANTPYAVEGEIKDAKNLILTMDQAVVDVTSIASTDVVVKDKNGIIVDNSKYTVAAAGETVTITSKNTTDLFDVKGKYTVEFKKEIVKYAEHKTSVAGYSLVQNKNEAFSITFGTPDADQYKYYAVPTNAVTLLTTNEVLVDYGTSMDKATALNAANYKLDGQALPAGAKLDFYDKDSKVLIKLPEGSLKQSGEYRLTVEKSVQTAKGQSVVKDAQTLDTFVGTFVGADNVAPKLVGAKYLVTDLEYKNDSDATKLELTFSEEVVVSASNNVDDVVAYFGSGASAQEIKGTVAAHPTDKTKVIFTAESGKVFNVSQSVTVKVLAEKDQKDTTSAIKDAKGNKAEEASVTVTSADKVIDKDQIASDAAAAAVFAKAKTEAIKELDAYKTAEYDAAEQEELKTAKENAVKAIEAAKTDAELTKAKGEAKTALDAVKTTAQKADEADKAAQAVVDAEAAKIKSQTLEGAVNTVVLPTVASGFTVAVKTSATPANYSATGELLVAGKSEVVYTVTNTASGKKADSASVEITVVIK